MGFLKEFRDFAMKGNLVDIAVAFVMGGAFGKVVTSLTEKVVAPLIGLVGGADLSKHSITLKPAVMEGDKVVKEAVVLGLGDFLTSLINFILVAFVMFLIIKAINALKKKEAEAPAPPSSTDQLLTEIRDELKKGK